MAVEVGATVTVDVGDDVIVSVADDVGVWVIVNVALGVAEGVCVVLGDAVNDGVPDGVGVSLAGALTATTVAASIVGVLPTLKPVSPSGGRLLMAAKRPSPMIAAAAANRIIRDELVREGCLLSCKGLVSLCSAKVMSSVDTAEFGFLFGNCFVRLRDNGTSFAPNAVSSASAKSRDDANR